MEAGTLDAITDTIAITDSSPDLSPTGMLPPLAGLVAYWPLDEVDTIAHDATANHNDGIIDKATQIVGKVGIARHFNGTACIRVPESISLDMEGSGAVTVMAWIIVDACPSSREVIVGKSGEYEEAALCNAVDYVESTSTPGNGWTPHGTHALALSIWHHVATTWDGTTVRQYVDGIAEDNRSLGGVLSATKVLGLAYGLGIGCGNVPPNGTGTVAYDFVGTIDEVAIYGRALSASEIFDYYTRTM